ncbi:AzlD domain-containing protein [[Clostridium] spiroforme]|nr:AzlD domain-containing protein [Thomasclavelia spiroformis]MBM6881113.1 AzlD domain-containing protein [Thomasclavelia spiroformis]
MNLYLLGGVFVMAICTYIPRMLPLTFFKKEITSPFIKSLLYYVPYAVLSALTFPSIFYATGNIVSSLLGCITAIYFAYKGKGLVLVALLAMIAVFVVDLLISIC